MVDQTSALYSAAQSFRAGSPEDVRQALVDARRRTLVLADAYLEALGARDMRVPYRATLNPPLWELGHIGWFQEWWIARNAQRWRGAQCDPDHERGPSRLAGSDHLYDSSRVAHRTRWELPLPSAAATRAWLADTFDDTLSLLDRVGHEAGDDDLYFFRLVAAHEEMHAEAALYMARALDVAVPAGAVRATEPLRGARTVRVPARRFTAGWLGPGFAFDNELGAHEVSLDTFEIDAEPVSWQSLFEFEDDGGYEAREWWSDEGWRWLGERGLPRRDRAALHERAAAVHLSWHEAQAWCRWAGRRLPTEFEWECAALTAPGFSWGQVWEWTQSDFVPYPGFAAHPYADYSRPWFHTRKVLRGACPATAGVMVHPRYRNFFEPHRSDIFAGFRSCV